MRSLITCLSNALECDGAATPGSVMGVGNPMAPDGTNVGSGDMFPPKRKKRVKPGKESQEWPNDSGQIKEGLLSTDFGDIDDDLGLGFDHTLETIMNYAKKRSSITEKDWVNLYNIFKSQCREMQANTKPATMTIKKACLSKDYTIIAFLDKTTGGYKHNTQRFTYGIEIRKFIKNPRPIAVQVSYDPSDSELRFVRDYNVNHPQMLNFKLSEWFALPGIVWDQMRTHID